MRNRTKILLLTMIILLGLPMVLSDYQMQITVVPEDTFSPSALPDTISSYDKYQAPVADAYYTDVDFSKTYDMDRTVIWWGTTHNTTYWPGDDIDELEVSIEIIDSDTVRLHKDDHASWYNGFSGETIWYEVYVLEFSVASGVEVEHIFGPDTFGVYPIGDTLDSISNAFVWSWGAEGLYTDMRTSGVGGPRILNTTHYELLNPSNAADHMNDQYVQIVHGDVFTVYNGSKLTVSAEVNVTDSIGATIDPSKSIVQSFMDTVENIGAYVNRYGSAVELNTTHIIFHSDQSVTWGSDNKRIYWWVIESDIFSVQQADVPYGTGERMEDITIDAVTNIDATVVFGAGFFAGWGAFSPWVSGFTDGSTSVSGWRQVGPVYYMLSSTTNLRVNCSSQSTYFQCTLFVLEFVDIPNEVPVNDQAPTLDNPSDSDNMYAHYVKYQITVYVSDADGYADIDYLEIGLWSNDRATEYWRGRYDEDTNTFSEQYDGGTYVELDAGSSSATESGNDIDATFYITIDWDFPDISDMDAKCYVVDDEPESDTDWYEVNWDVETRLDYSVVPAVTGDDSGTIDRGDLDEAFTIEGTVKYYGSSLVPPDAEYDVWASSGEYGTTVGPFSDLSPVSGAFSVTCYADDVVGIDTWTIKPVEAGTGSGGTSLYYTTDLTDAYISDQVKVSGYTDSVTGDYNIGRVSAFGTHYEYIYATLVYAYDSAQVTTGSFTIQSKTATHTGSGVWRITETYSTSCNVTYDTVAGSDTTHGITTVDQNGQETWMVYTRLIIQNVYSDEADNRTQLEDPVWFYFQMVVEFTGEAMIGSDNPGAACNLYYTWTGDSFGFSLQGATDSNNDGVWIRLSTSAPSPLADGVVRQFKIGQAYSPNFYAAYLYPNKYDLEAYVFRTVDPYLFTFDQIHVTSYASNFTRCDLNTNVGVNVTLKYDYDETAVTDEDVWVDGYHFTHIENGIYGIDTVLSYGTVTALTLDFVQIPTYNNTWGLTGYYAISQNGKSITIIWDTITVTMATNMTWSYIGYNVQITATATYTYDGTSSDATVTINSTMSSPHVATFATVGLRSYTATGISGDSNGITGWSTDSVSVIWDKMVVPSYSYYWTQQDIWNVWLQVTSNVWVFEYDNDPMSTYTDSGSSSDIRFYANGTNNEYSSLDEVGNLPTTGVGPFTPSWYYANISLYWQSTCQGRTYNLYVTHFVVEVQILHSIHIEDSGIDVQDDWITFVFHTNWDNASFTIWDNITGTPALVGYSKDEGWYQIAKPTVVGAHKYIVLINGTHDGTDSTGQIATGSDGDSWKYRYFTLTVNPTTLSLTNVLSTADSAHISLTVTASASGNYYVYDNGTYQTVTGSFSSGIVTVTWSKLTTVGLHIWSVHFNDSSTSLWINGSYDVSSTTFLISDITVAGGSTTVVVSAYANSAGNYYVYSNDTYKTVTGAFIAGSVVTTFNKLTTTGLHVWAVKYNNSAGVTRWVNGSYDVSSTTFLVTDLMTTADETTIYVSGYSTTAFTYIVFEEGLEVETGSGSAGSFIIDWSRDTTDGTIDWEVRFFTGESHSHPTVASVTYGTYLSGDLTSFTLNDSDYYNATEAVGAPGLRMEMNFTVTLAAEIHALIYYDGNLGHSVWLQAYDFGTNTWVNIKQITDDTGFSWFNTSLSLSRTWISGGKLLTRINHATSGNINHHVCIDFMSVVTYSVMRYTAGSYYNAPTVLEITDTLYTNSESYNRLSGQTTLGATWTAYDNGATITTGTITAGSFSITWARQTAKGLHNWNVTFTDGTTTIVKFGSYESDGLLIVQLYVGQDNDTIYISGQLYSTDWTLNYWVWENTGSGNVLMGSGAITLLENRGWFSVAWTKSAENVEANWTLTITDGSNNSTAYGYYTELDSAVTNITNNASFLQDNSVNTTDIMQGDVYNSNPQSDMWNAMGYILTTFAMVFLIGVVWQFSKWKSVRRKKQDRSNDWLRTRR